MTKKDKKVEEQYSTAVREPFEWLTEDSRVFLQRGYLLEGVSAKERIREIANHAESVLVRLANGDKNKLAKIKGFADKFYDYMGKGWFSLSSPVWSNYGLERGKEISCFGSYIGDSINDIMSTTAEVGMMSKMGGGTSGYFGGIRPRGSAIKNNGKSDGSFNFTKLFDTVIDVISQGTCYVEGTRVLTNNGFKDFRDVIKGVDLLAQVDEENNVSFTDTYDLIMQDYSGEIYHYENEKYKVAVTPNHRMVIEKDGKKQIVLAKDLKVDNTINFPVVNGLLEDKVEDFSVYYVNGLEVSLEKKQYNGGVYCATVPTGKLVVEYKNTQIVCGNSRKGQFAGYIDIEHGDIEEWLDIHTEGNPIQLMYYGVCVGNDWLKEMEVGDSHKRAIWAKVLARKKETGIPYIFFKDNANLNTVDVYKDKNKTIYASNLCIEIMLPSSVEESFVCCLSSMNLLHYDEWKNTDAIEVLTYFLDTVLEEFIRKTENENYLEKARRFAMRHRALGVGVLGWHSYLQSHSIPFDSFDANLKNREVFKLLKEKTYKASAELAELFGEPEILKGYGRRNTTLMAIAPTKSSSFILGEVSQGIEPFKSNYTVKDLAKIKKVWRNPYLQKLLAEKGMDNEEVWDSIRNKDGSVQHLNFLSEHEKDVFKTFSEISQLAVIQQAAQRQKYIDQGQSLNIMIHPSTSAKDINKLYMSAAEMGIKGIYYQYSMSAAQVFNRSLLENSCSNCEA